MNHWARRLYVEGTGVLVIAGFLYMILSGVTTIEEKGWLTMLSLPHIPSSIQNLSTVFLSIFIEGIPFILLGVLISSVIQVSIQEETLFRWIPKNPLLAIPLTLTLGLVLPICECGIVPVARRLIQKGLPPYIPFTFLLAAPVINPITLMATYFAFGSQWDMVINRALLAGGIATVMGLLCYRLSNQGVLTINEECEGACTCHHGQEHARALDQRDRMSEALYHGIFELMNMGKYFIGGALLAATFQTYVGYSLIAEWSHQGWLPILLMMGLAFGLSLCSSADAFVAASFRGVMPTAPLLAFLVYGPIMDLKNLLMMLGSFRKRIVIFFFVGTTLLTLVSIHLS
ncbi:permease [Marininema halotolerans]|uniref:Permease n=1 Tax=Marininema halotolerans TaxID=1155944 RepID=A0A1I6UD76_9BACL|nr:permease [Marininema halotolerans]SFS99364.1 hypothetical protein SAMN05444972_11566 [Marininema halotolerans]